MGWGWGEGAAGWGRGGSGARAIALATGVGKKHARAKPAAVAAHTHGRTHTRAHALDARTLSSLQSLAHRGTRAQSWAFPPPLRCASNTLQKRGARVSASSHEQPWTEHRVKQYGGTGERPPPPPRAARTIKITNARVNRTRHTLDALPKRRSQQARQMLHHQHRLGAQHQQRAAPARRGAPSRGHRLRGPLAAQGVVQGASSEGFSADAADILQLLRSSVCIYSWRLTASQTSEQAVAQPQGCRR